MTRPDIPLKHQAKRSGKLAHPSNQLVEERDRALRLADDASDQPFMRSLWRGAVERRERKLGRP